MKDPYLFNKMFDSSESPLLEDKEELCLASIVFKLATKEVDPYDENDDYDESDADSVLSFSKKVETTRKNLRHVRDLFAQTNRARRRFLRNFPAWSILRQKNIEQLRNIVQRILGDRFNGNISKLVGGCTGVVGGGCLVGSLLCPPAAPVLLPLAIGGGVASALGGGVVFGTSVTEIVLLKKKLEEAKAVIEKDRDAFSAMKHWFEHTKELMDAIEEIVGFDLMKKMTNDVKKFVEEAKEKMTKRKDKERAIKKGEYNDDFRELLEKCVKQMCSSGRIQAKFGVELAPVVVTFVFVVCLMCQRNRFLFSCLVITHRIGMGLLSFLDVGVELGRLVTALVLRGGEAAMEVVPKAGARAVALGVFAGLGIAIDLANVVVTSFDVHKGSVSEEAMKVDEVADKLAEEYRFLEEVHSEILNSITR